MSMKKLLTEIKACNVCAHYLTLGPNPVVTASTTARLLIIGQAPGIKVHQTGIPWNDASGQLLREWMDVSPAIFYDEKKIAIAPMGFCYPGKGKNGDLPPRPECAPLWHASLLKKMKQVQLILLIGQYAQRYYLGDTMGKNLTETVRHYKTYLPLYFPLPHPSPRNRIWLKRNEWFGKKLLPDLKKIVHQVLEL